MEIDTPLNAPFGWMGGKSKLRPTLATLIPEQNIPIKTRKIQRYVEVFGGVAWLLLYKNKWFQNEVYNDINDGLVNLFSVIRFHPDELIKEIELVVNSQKLFNYYTGTLHLTDIQKAAGTIIKYGWSFSGKGTSYNFKGNNSAQTLISKISGLRKRLQNVAVSNESFEKCIKRWDKGNTFLYLDPPYFGTEKVYPGITFGVEDHVLLSELLKNCQATWMLSYGDHPVIREFYKDFYITETAVKYCGLANSTKQYDAAELIITNYPVPENTAHLF